MNKAKTLKMKLIYVIAALAMLAMLIPAMAIPVSAGGNTPVNTMLIDVQLPDGSYAPDGAVNSDGKYEGFNVAGSIIRVTAPGTVTLWNLDVVATHYADVDGNYGPAHWLGDVNPNNVTPIPSVVYVQGTWGEAHISATVDNIVYTAVKKWGMITGTEFTQAKNTTTVTWNETSKSWFADGAVSDTVNGTFTGTFPGSPAHLAQGAILNWYLVSGDADLSDLQPAHAGALKTAVLGKTAATYVQFIDPLNANWGYNKWHHTVNKTNGWLGTAVQNVTGVNGAAGVSIGAWFEESVQIVVIPEYPNYPNRNVTPEITSYNFGTTEMESVPQVRWAGEKIVLEANFGTGLSGHEVQFFFQNQSVGTLEGISDDDEAATVWTRVNGDGVASAILYSAVPGQSDVIAALYSRDGRRGEDVTNQYAFRVYFLNFESLKLTNVVGKRTGHYEGLFEPANPWKAGHFDSSLPENVPGEAGYDYNEPINDPTFTDKISDTLNVSQDTLLRAVVKGYFTNNTPSSRTAGLIPNTNPDKPGLVLPAGRWVLPDDWDTLATLQNSTYQQTRRFWDIMDAPNDAVKSSDPLGPYVGETSPTIGPFAPGIECMTPYGWMADNPVVDDHRVAVPGTSNPTQYTYPREINTVVPNNALDFWDAPMPPAKVILDILNVQEMEDGVDIGNSGYFKSAMKTQIYYVMDGGLKYTAPFYKILIPAHEAIPAFNIASGGGYDWDSFDGTHGPYAFWTIINKPEGAPVASTNPGLRPTKVQVYSDNHGEAMVWLNGDWNLDLSNWDSKGGADVPYGTRVGSTTVQAQVDYPYIRNSSPIYSNTVVKDWTWGGDIVGTDQTTISSTGAGPAMVLTAGGDGYSASAITLTRGASLKDSLAWGTSNDHVIWVWLTDRDGKIDGVLDATIVWQLKGSGQPTLYFGGEINGINQAGQWSPQITIDGNGFLDGTNGVRADANMDNIVGWSTVKVPTEAEKQLFVKTYPSYTLAEAANYAVAAIDVETGAPGDNTVTMTIGSTDFAYWDINGSSKVWKSWGSIKRTTNFNAATEYPLDDQILTGDANVDKVVNMLDITAVERYILGMDNTASASADANYNHVVDMGDVVKIERIYLGLE